MIVVNDILCVEPFLEKLDGVIFDLDDTLFSEKEYVRSGFRAIAAMYPFVTDLSDKLWASFLDGRKAIDDVFEREGITDCKQEALSVYRRHIPNISLYPGIKEMLVRLRINGKRIGIITDGRPEGQQLKVETLGLADLVDKIIITDTLGGIQFRKPDCTAFILMQKEFAIPFESICYVGDNLRKDFIAPKQLGMKCFFFDNPDGLYT